MKKNSCFQMLTLGSEEKNWWPHKNSLEKIGEGKTKIGKQKIVFIS